MKASVILATYNQPAKLAASLYSLSKQSEKDFEIVIADDGSRDETRRLIEEFRRVSRTELVHEWQDDEGFRKARILNASIRKARSTKLVFMDGDTFAHKDFIKDHLEALETADVFLGRRVMLGPDASRMVENDPSLMGTPEFWILAIASTFFKKTPTKHLNRGLRLPAWLRSFLKYDRVPDLIGCNFSATKAALLKVNGFDEAHVGYGNEDGDLYIRLRNSGARIAGSKCYAVQWHLWHQERSFKPGAETLYNERLANDRSSVSCSDGLEKFS
ncbi:MAG: glycosyltransferase [Bdellovibrionota bacterium]